MQFSMKQFLTGILNSDSYRLSAYSKGHRSLEAIGGVRPRYVGVTWARAATHRCIERLHVDVDHLLHELRRHEYPFLWDYMH